MHQPAPTVTRHDFIETTARDGRVLVVVFLRGGADGLTLVPPVADPMYRTARPTLAVRAKDAIDLNGYFAVHRDLDALMPYIERQELAIVHGAGSDDTTRSHFEAQDTMEHGGVQTGSGWLGRFLRAQGPVASALSAVAIGTTRPESLRGAPAGAVMQTVREFSVGGDDDAVMEQLARLYAAFGGPVGAAGRDTIDAVRRLRALRAEGGAAESSTPYPPGTFGRGLREIAKLIKADVGLTTTTIDLDGWDTHFVQGRVVGGLMEQLGAGIDAFMTDLGSRRDGVTVVVLTEFGRRLRENSSFGTDHGAGSVMMVLGAAAPVVAAGHGLVGGFEQLSESMLDDVGDIPARTDYRDVLASVLTHHAPAVDLRSVFPGRAAALSGGQFWRGEPGA